ncbi:hypothetical protein PsYK624_022350 [Phanerochaete sordida]|uniref:Uncharacterized protein n=1 Tax=Phanerochaete sordida TaxID=48140 RepID=A0A9P3L8J3_9APHY|nr:hypothetical protein PsYK624_022350 [Phanerochaete sordida]
MPRRDLESQMRYEDAVLDSMLALPSRRRNDEDEDYDVYLFWPSSPESHVLLSERLSRGTLSEVSSPTLHNAPASNEGHLSTYPSVYRPSIDSEDGMQAASIIPPPSPTYTFVSDYVFPEREQETGMDVAGYSRIFTAGLALTSRQITRQIGTFYRDLQRAFNWSSWVRRTA